MTSKWWPQSLKQKSIIMQAFFFLYRMTKHIRARLKNVQVIGLIKCVKILLHYLNVYDSPRKAFDVKEDKKYETNGPSWKMETSVTLMTQCQGFILLSSFYDKPHNKVSWPHISWFCPVIKYIWSKILTH